MESLTPSSAVQRPVSVLVVHGDSFISLSIVRSIGRQGVPVSVLYSGNGVAARSRYCSYKEKYSSESEVIHRVRKVIAERAITHVIATSENLISLLNRFREEFEGLCTFLFPPQQIFERSLQKDQTLAIAEQIGVPIPRTITVAQSADLEPCRELNYPIAVKPRGGGGAEPFKVQYCNSHQELTEMLRGILDGNSFLVQEYVRGSGVGIEVLMRRGAPLMVFSHVRIREYPPTGGVSTCCKSIKPDPVLVDYSVRLLQAMEWEGVAMVEFKVNYETHRVGLMEVNGRFWGSLPLAIQAGADFPFQLLWTASASDLKEPFRPKYGVLCRLLISETKWLLAVLRTGYLNRGRALWEYLSAFTPSCRYYCFSFDDPAPAVAAIIARFKAVYVQAIGRMREPKVGTRDSG